MNPTNFGEQLKIHRQALGLTQSDVAEKMHVSRQTISSWETGRNTPDIITLKQLALLYGVSTDNLLQVLGAKKLSPLPKSRQNSAIFLFWLTLGILIAGRLLVITTFEALHWMTSLIFIMIGVHLLLRLKPSKWKKPILVSTHIILGVLSFMSAILKLWDMSFGVQTVCVMAGFILVVQGILYLRNDFSR